MTVWASAPAAATASRRRTNVEWRMPNLTFGIWHLSFDMFLPLRGRRHGSGASRVEIVPVQDRVEAEEEVPLRLPAPERTVGEHHDVPLADRRVDGDGAAGNRVAADEQAREQQ